jgi:polysaccharide export outer membrane protein
MQQKDRSDTKWLLPVILCIIIIISSSCTSYRKSVYLSNISDSLTGSMVSFHTSPYVEPRIQPDDILQVSVQTLDPQTNVMPGTSNTTIYSTQPTSSASNTIQQQPTIAGYLVDQQGFIELPLVGRLAVGGKTTTEARDAIREKAAVYYKMPVVNIRYANFRVTVLGEVNRPAQYIIPNEKVSILDIIGMAGDLTIYGKRENIMLIREVNGEKQITRFNLNTSDILSSPYYYLRQGDIIYVQHNKSKSAATDMVRARNFSFLATGISLLAVILSRVTF